MTIQALILLFKLKRAQISEGGTVYFDNENLFLCTVQEDNSPVTKVSIRKYERSFYSTVEYLTQQGLVKVETPFYIYGVTHKGWCIWQTLLSKIAWFLFSSIFVPIFVAAITTLVTLWITGHFQGTIPAA